MESDESVKREMVLQLEVDDRLLQQRIDHKLGFVGGLTLIYCIVSSSTFSLSLISGCG